MSKQPTLGELIGTNLTKMKKYLYHSWFITISLLTGIFFSCSEDTNTDGQNDSNPQNRIMVGTKWTNRDWNYDIDNEGNWAYYYDDIYTLYFYSETEGVAYYGRKIVDSDTGVSLDRSVCFFKYNLNGNNLKIETITDAFPELNYQYTLDNNKLISSGYNMSKGSISIDDNNWLNTIKGKTGDCTWYYNYMGTLTIAGKGKMADYKSYSATPWNNKYHIINHVCVLDGVDYIGSYAFASPSISSVKFSNTGKNGGLSKIGKYAFAGSCLGTVYLFHVKYIDEGAFCDCECATLYFYEDIEEIGKMACANCKEASLSLTCNLRKVADNAFMGCEIKSWTNSKVIESIGSGAFGKINTKEIDLPKIKELGHYAFYDDQIENIHIGANLQIVEGTPFGNVASTGKVKIDVQYPLTLKYNFINESRVKNWNLIVPTGSLSYYQNAKYWNNFRFITDEDGTDSNNQGDEAISIQTLNAIPGIFEAKLYGRFNSVPDEGNVYFRVSKSSFFIVDCFNTSEISVSLLSDKTFEIILQTNLDANTEYFYQAVYENGKKITYGETKTFKTSKSNCPSNLQYTINDRSYKMIFVSGCISGDFYMMQTELPSDQEMIVYDVCMERLRKSNYEVVLRSGWSTFIDELRLKTGIAWRLPTTIEWKYAAKGGSLSKGYKYSGSNNISDVAWYSQNSNRIPHNIALKEPNEIGLYDMSGNYAELTFGENLYDVDGDFYGGCWNYPSYECTVNSYKNGVRSGKIDGTPFVEKYAFNAKYITVRLVYSAE